VVEATGDNGRVQFDGRTITITARGLLGSGKSHSFELDTVTDIEWKAPGFTSGFLHFVIPGGKPHGSNRNGARADDNTILVRTRAQGVEFSALLDDLARAAMAAENARLAAGTQICPQCAEDVKAAALVCRYCGYDFALRWHPAPEHER
jgi:hypothetical protein